MEKIKNGKIIGFFVIGLVTGLAMLVGIARLTWHTKFYPGVTIANVSVAGLNRAQAYTKLEEVTKNYQVKIEYGGGSWQIPREAVGTLIEASLNEAYRYGRRAEISDYLLLLVNKKTNYPLLLMEGQSDVLVQKIEEIATVAEIVEKEPEIIIRKNEIIVENGVDGERIDGERLDRAIRESYSMLSETAIQLPTNMVKRQLDGDSITKLKERGKKLLTKSLNFSIDDEKISLHAKELIPLLSTLGGEVVDTERTIDLVEALAESWNRQPQDAKFEYSEGKVKEFLPGKDGLEIMVPESKTNIHEAIIKLLETDEKNIKVELAVYRVAPKVTIDKVNELGIRERIGRGESYYEHSIPNRIFNVALASERINSALIGPGEEVSFNKLVGEVSGETGYRPAYVIEKGRTVLGDGGGLCQVSTTMFRAAMTAGLPILERWGHAYRVSYYELDSKPGVDATVYAPSKDFKFKNDTPGHLLIQTINDPKKLHLVIEIYGTSDGRVATIENHKVWGITSPLPTIYQDDPTLPSGTMKQVDWAAAGAKASFEYKVVRNGDTIQDKTFSTTYRPWASVYLKGTGQ